MMLLEWDCYNFTTVSLNTDIVFLLLGGPDALLDAAHVSLLGLV